MNEVKQMEEKEDDTEITEWDKWTECWREKVKNVKEEYQGDTKKK